MALATPALIVLALVTYYAGLFFFSNKAPKGLRLPPGPMGFPLIGSVFQYPRVHPWRVFAEWSKIYGKLFFLCGSQLRISSRHNTFVGPIINVTVLGRRTFILNSGKVATDLLESRSALYSDRPNLFGTVAAGQRSAIFQTRSVDPYFKPQRRLLHAGLNPRASRSYRSIQMEETMVLLNSLVEAPDDFGAHIRRLATMTPSEVR